MEVGDLFGGPGVATPARTVAPNPTRPADTAYAGGSEGIGAAGVTRVDMPGIDLYKNANYRWCESSAPWFGVQVLLFRDRFVADYWPRMGEMLCKAVMRWLPESGRQIVRDALEEIDYG